MSYAATLYNEGARDRQGLASVNKAWIALPLAAQAAGGALSNVVRHIDGQTSRGTITPGGAETLMSRIAEAETQLKALKAAMRNVK